MTRNRLPNRRPSVTRDLEFGGKAYRITAGFEVADGGHLVLLREVFITGGIGRGSGGAKTGQDLMHVIEDASVLISLALQRGATPAELANSLARLPSGPLAPGDLDRSDGGAPQREPASILGAVVDLLAELQAETAAECEA